MSKHPFYEQLLIVDTFIKKEGKTEVHEEYPCVTIEVGSIDRKKFKS